MAQVYSPEELEQRYDEFLALREEGLARYFGVARYAKEYYPAMMKVMERGIVDFVQFNYSIMEPEAADDILPLAQETGTAVIANRTFIPCMDIFLALHSFAIPSITPKHC